MTQRAGPYEFAPEVAARTTVLCLRVETLTGKSNAPKPEPGMKQLRQISILVRGAQLLLLVLALFWLYGWCRMQGKSMHPGTEASEAETDGGDVAENEKMEPPGI